MIAHMLAKNGFLDSLISKKAGTAKADGSMGSGLFSNMLAQAGKSAANKNPMRLPGQNAVSHVEQLRSKIAMTGAKIENVLLGPENRADIEALLIFEGFSRAQVKNIMAGLTPEKGKGQIRALDLFARVAGKTPVFGEKGRGRLLEPSAIPHIESALCLAGLDPEKSKWVISRSMTKDGKLSLGRLVRNLKQVPGLEDAALPDAESVQKIFELLDRAQIMADRTGDVFLDMEDLEHIFEDNAFGALAGAPVPSQARIQAHLDHIIENSTVQAAEDKEIPLSKLVESRLKIFGEEDFKDMPRVFVEMALRRLGIDPADAGRIAALTNRSHDGQIRVPVHNLKQTNDPKQNPVQNDKPVLEYFIKGPAQNDKPVLEHFIKNSVQDGGISRWPLTLSDFEKFLSKIGVQVSPSANAPLIDTQKFRSVADIFSVSGEKIVPRTLSGLASLVAGFAERNEPVPEAAIRDLANVPGRAGPDNNLVERILSKAWTPGKGLDSPIQAKGIEKAVQSVSMPVFLKADTQITAMSGRQMNNNLSDLLQFLENSKQAPGYLPDFMAVDIARSLEQLGITAHEAGEILAEARFPGKGLDPVLLIHAVKKLAIEMGIEPKIISEVTSGMDVKAISQRVGPILENSSPGTAKNQDQREKTPDQTGHKEQTHPRPVKPEPGLEFRQHARDFDRSFVRTKAGNPVFADKAFAEPLAKAHAGKGNNDVFANVVPRAHVEADAKPRVNGPAIEIPAKIVQAVHMEENATQRVYIKVRDVFVKSGLDAHEDNKAVQPVRAKGISEAVVFDHGAKKAVFSLAANTVRQKYKPGVAARRARTAQNIADPVKAGLSGQETGRVLESKISGPDLSGAGASAKAGTESLFETLAQNTEKTGSAQHVPQGSMAAENTSQTVGSAKNSFETQGVQHVFQDQGPANVRAEAMPDRPVLRPFEEPVARQLGMHISQALNQKDKNIRIRLHPRQLGSINVSMNFKSNVLTVGMSAETEAAREILLSHVGELRSSLADQGILVDKIEISVRPDPDQNFARQQQQGRGRSSRPSNERQSHKAQEIVTHGHARPQAESGLDLMA